MVWRHAPTGTGFNSTIMTCRNQDFGDDHSMKKKQILFLGFVLAVGLMAGCSRGEGQTPTPVQSEPAASPTDIPTETVLPPKLVLVVPPGSDPAQAAAVGPAAAQAAGEFGLAFEQRENLASGGAPENLRMVVAIPPDPGVAGLASAMPETQFVAVGINGVSPSGNLTVLSGSEGQTDHQGFMAGYMAAMQANEWRVGMVGVSDEAGRRYQKAFENGAIYYCGFCNPTYPPYNDYPILVEANPGASLVEKQQAADTLLSQSITVVHVDPRAGEPQLWAYLAERGMLLVGDGAPPAGLESVWLASVDMGPTTGLGETLVRVLQNGAQGEIGSGLSFTNINPQEVSEGRVKLVNEIYGMLVNEVIDPMGQ